MSKQIGSDATNTNKVVRKKKLPKTPPQKAARNKKGTKQARKARKTSAKTPRVVHFAECSRLYLRATLDPWDVLNHEDHLPCIPDEFDQPSFKYGTRVRGTFTIGTQGIGFVVASPLNGVLTSNTAAYTGSGFTGTTISTGVTGVTLASDAQLVAASAAVAPNYRLVACGLRVRYTGTTLNAGGQILPFRALPSGDSVNGCAFADILQRQDHSTKPCTRAWYGTVWFPTFADATKFTASSFDVTSSFNQKVGVIVSGAAGNTYEFDMVRFWEVVADTSNAVQATFTPIGISKSHTDLTGLGWVRDYLGGLTVDDYGKVAYDAGVRYVSGIAMKSMASFVSGFM
jgi:hypothetical protein